MKKYICKFEENIFIYEKSEDYKKLCNFEKRPNDKKAYKKFYDRHMFRYSLKCKLQDKGEKITVILMNPSYADEYGLDSTLTNVKEFLEKQKQYSEFEVLNIFPVRTADSDNLVGKMKKYKEIQKKNDEYIEKTLKNSRKVLVAWGSRYHRYAHWVFELLKDKEVYVYAVNKNGSPRHFAPQAYNKVKKQKLQEYVIKN